MDVLYIGPYYQNDEWGNTSKALAQLLTTQDINLVLRPVWFANHPQENITDIERLQPYEFNTLNKHDILIQHGLPTYLNYNGNFTTNIAVTSIDCRIDNTDWATHLNLFDQVIVFSEYEAELLKKSGVTAPIGPFKFTPVYISPQKQDLELSFSGTKFYTTGSLDLKTGLRETICAYLTAFTILDNVILIIATSDSQGVQSEIQNIKNALGIFYNEKHYANIAIISSNDMAVLNYLHENNDFFIDVSYNLRTNQNLLTAVINNSFPIILDTCENLFPSYPFITKSQAEISLYLQRPLASLYTGDHTWQIPIIHDLQDKLKLAHHKHTQHNLKTENETLLDFKSKMLSLQNEWIKECIH